MVWGSSPDRGPMERWLNDACTFPTDRALHLAENSYHIAYRSDSKANAFCNHHMLDPITCKCGEEAAEFAWVWSTKEEGGQAGNIVLGPESRQISFNPEYSSGTASVRGNQILPKNYQHYWEIKLTNAVYGTNIMIGVCTPQCDMNHGVYRFCSLIGRDEESWGYSYKGTTQHGGNVSRYGPRWGKGAIVGVHLDTWRGKLEFFLNREPLGIAFEGLRNKDLYPIVASTSAHSGMKLVASYMFPHNLQFLSSEALFKRCPDASDVHPKELSLPPGLQTLVQKNYWPFIKCVSLKIGSNRLDYIRRHGTKRHLESSSKDVHQCKRLCAGREEYSFPQCCDVTSSPRKQCQGFRLLFNPRTSFFSGSESQRSSSDAATEDGQRNAEDNTHGGAGSSQVNKPNSSND
ncbi:LOW QUALITY PROTEIN: SPRY domain-containing SOCS box protein 3-like [Palaemon carinicauda]|uniref:LOW QUALITY PROTEIN: SPRY domain-containing SOCS box protein 3-like n=1 Tax=Palaemon carinicauda TaxID=392227 RepID=UPI0035B5C73E